MGNDINLSIAELGVICNNLQTFDSELASAGDVHNIVQAICDYVYQSIGSDFYDMWIEEFQIE